MNKYILPVTRALVKAAHIVSGFIIANAARIVAVATAIHAWSLDKTVAVADAKTDKIFLRVDALEAQRKVVESARRAALKEADEAARAAQVLYEAVQVEKGLLTA